MNKILSLEEINKIKSLIAESRIEKAFEVISDVITNDKKIQDEYILIKAKWSRGKKDYNIGIITNEEWNLLRNQVNNSLLILLEKTPNIGEVSKENKILFIYSNPNGKYDLGFDKEVEIIRNSIDKSGNRDKYGLIVEGGVTIEDLEILITKYNPKIVHFSVNSIINDGDGLMLFEGANGSEFEFDHEIFEEIINEIFSRETVTECFVLNTCFSKKYGEILSQKINHVVAMQDFLSKNLAFEVSRIFYTNLLSGKSVEESFNKMQRNLKLNKEMQRHWDIPRRPEDVPILIKNKLINDKTNTLI